MFPLAFVEANGEQRIYYNGRTAIEERPFEALPRMGMAVSTDGVTWNLWDDPSTQSEPYHKSDPLLREGTADESWVRFGVAPSTVLRTDTGWELFFLGFGWPPLTEPTPDRPTFLLGHATSHDGVQWSKSDTVGLIDTGEKRWPLVSTLRVGDEYFMYYDWHFGDGIGLLRVRT